MEVGAVDEHLVVDAVGVGVCWRLDVPEGFAPSSQGASGDAVTVGDSICGIAGENPLDEGLEMLDVSGMTSGVGRRCIAVGATPALLTCCGAAGSSHGLMAYRAGGSISLVHTWSI